ncbi:Autophagy protein 16 [Spathaspora sp. JA1]|nr:Autophagy protein 16 [Spathaspora sp. JA1]
MNSTWTDDILKQLEIRDEFEQRDFKYFTAFNQLTQQLQIQQLANKQRSQTPSPSLTSTTLKHEDLDRTIIIRENQQLKNDNNDLVSSLNMATIKNEKLEQEIKERDSNIKMLSRNNDKLKKKVDSLNLEIKEKNKTIEIINDEILTNQIQYNVLNEELRTLARKNK